MTETEMLSDREIVEIEEMFPHAEYQPSLSPDEVPPCEFCKGTIDDHKANCVVPHVHALCQTVRALRKELSEAYYESCEICDQEIVSGDGTKIHTFAVGGCCWNKSQETIAALRDQLARSQAENERLASQLKEWQEDKDTKAGYL